MQHITLYPDDGSATGLLMAVAVFCLGPLWNHWLVLHVADKGSKHRREPIVPRHAVKYGRVRP